MRRKCGITLADEYYFRTERRNDSPYKASPSPQTSQSSSYHSRSPNLPSPTTPTSPTHSESSAYSKVLKSELFSQPPTPLLFTEHPTSIPSSNFYSSPYSLSPIGQHTQALLKTPPKAPRKISTQPVRILEAPSIKDDYYLNLIDWSSQNTLAVALESAVYLWNASTSKVIQLCNLEHDSVTGVSWMPNGDFLAVGTNKGLVQLWDVSRKKKVRELQGHKSRVGVLAWNSNNFLSSGSRDRLIFNRDLRCKNMFVNRWHGHRQEVCGLEWSNEGEQLASGGNDNKLLIWDVRSVTPIIKFSDHSAAVKAISWSPHRRGLLASGGGTADRCIRFWNTLTGTNTSHVDTGSQVCNIAWSKNVNELVSTHGFSQHQIVVWSYPTMQPLATLTGHTSRVLYLSVSPDGQTIVTGAGDETLRFWNVFPSAPNVRGGTDSQIVAGGVKTIR
eukprot:TRINITY_DN12490_c0_g1_i1.p1 TRINITY_DN12490_c0_g1~~TRINITY_DN12490_c0_g1_i1.p1  ORF type:complete len:464 (+),score=66.37 TRINITY_DN12490_c0_g1_i1:59-1393(+)